MADIHLSETSLPVGGQELISTRWWGMMCLIATEGILFVYLIFAYAYLGSQSPGPWPPRDRRRCASLRRTPSLLLASSFLLGWGVRRGASKARLRLRSPAHLFSERSSWWCRASSGRQSRSC